MRIAVNDQIMVTTIKTQETVIGYIKDISYEDGYITVSFDYDGLEYTCGSGGHYGKEWVDCYGNPAIVVKK